MTIYRVTGSGQRRGLGNGGVRAVDQSGSATTSIQAALGQSSAAGAKPTARAMVSAAVTVAWALTGSPSAAGRITLGQSSAVTAQPSATAGVGAGLSQASALAASPIVRVPGRADLGQGSTVAAVPTARAPLVVGLAQSSALTGAPARLAAIRVGLSQSTTLAGKPRNNTSIGWRNRWLEAYGQRSALLVAIDEANRNLAKGADDRSKANATAIVTTNTRVTTVEGRIDAEATRITALQSTVAGKADSSALDALTTRVTVTEEGIDAQSQALTQVSATVGDQPANYVRKSTFGADLGIGQWSGGNVVAAPDHATGYALRATASVYEGAMLPCAPGDQWDITIDVHTAQLTGSSYVLVGLHTQTKNGVNDFPQLTADSTRQGWHTLSGRVTAPAGAIGARPFFFIQSGNGSPAYLQNFRAEKVTRAARQNATATELLEARATTLEGGQTALKAIHGVYLNVNGKISGTQSVNDGVVSNFEVLADIFRIISGGASGFEVQGGYQRNYSAGAQLITGHNFGSGDLTFWYGPNIGAAACTKQNATIWFDKAGNAYFGGSLSAGVLKNGAQSTQVSATAQVETGNFSSNGNARTITYSLNYGNNGTVQTSGAAGTAGPTSATVTLQRSVNGGAWTTLASFTATGQKTVTNDPELGYVVQVGCSGSSTFTDNSGGLGPINYRAVISNGSGNWPWINGQNSAGQQSLTILSIEQ